MADGRYLVCPKVGLKIWFDVEIADEDLEKCAITYKILEHGSPPASSVVSKFLSTEKSLLESNNIKELK